MDQNISEQPSSSDLGAKEIKKIARLARLQIDESDIPALTDELGNILHLVDQMESAPTDGVEPMAHPLDMSQRLRPDHITEADRREENQISAPHVEDGLYLVPKVID